MANKKTAAQEAATARREANKATAEAARAKAEAVRAKTLAVGGGHAEGFLNFIRQQGVIGLAVGLAIGAAAGASVKAIVEGFINPVINLLVGSQEGLVAATWVVTVNDRTATFGWGAVVSSLITLFATALVIYLIIHGAKLDRIDKKKS